VWRANPRFFRRMDRRSRFTGEYDGNVDVIRDSGGGRCSESGLTLASRGGSRAGGWTPGREAGGIQFPAAQRLPRTFFEMFHGFRWRAGVEERVAVPERCGGRRFSPERAVDRVRANRPGRLRCGSITGAGGPSKIWVGRMSDSAITPVPRIRNSNDFQPDVDGGFACSFSRTGMGRSRLYSYDVKTKAVKEAVANRGPRFQVGVGEWRCESRNEQFGGIYLYDLKTGKSNRVPIRLEGRSAGTAGRRLL